MHVHSKGMFSLFFLPFSPAFFFFFWSIKAHDREDTRYDMIARVVKGRCECVYVNGIAQRVLEAVVGRVWWWVLWGESGADVP